jgi:hypothetical protein
MNVYHSLDTVNPKHVYFFKPTPNKLSNYINFYKLVYNYRFFTLNTLLIWVDIKEYTVTEDHSRYRVSFETDPIFIERVKEFETHLLKQVNRQVNKQIMLSCYKALSGTRMIQTFDTPTPNVRVYLRISGVWESDMQIGLTHKLSVYSETVQNNLLDHN